MTQFDKIACYKIQCLTLVYNIMMRVCAIRFYVICRTANIVKWDLFYDTHNVRYKAHVYTFYTAINIGCLIYTQTLLFAKRFHFLSGTNFVILLRQVGN